MLTNVAAIREGAHALPAEGSAALRKLLLIDDDQTLAFILQTYLAQHGFELAWADRPSKGLAMLTEKPELLLLDVMLPERDGFEVCRQLREAGDVTPIIMLTGKGSDLDRIYGLDSGADDYLAKPFNHRELVSRIEAVLRRHAPTPHAENSLDLARRSLRLDGREIPLTAAEFRLFRALAQNPGRIYSRNELLDLMDDAGVSESYDRAIDSHISRLRAKIETNPREPKHLLTVRGLGYRFEW